MKIFNYCPIFLIFKLNLNKVILCAFWEFFLKNWANYNISVLTQSIRPKHLLSFKLHGRKREINCLAKITLAKGSIVLEAFFQIGFLNDKIKIGPCEHRTVKCMWHLIKKLILKNPLHWFSNFFLIQCRTVHLTSCKKIKVVDGI